MERNLRHLERRAAWQGFGSGAAVGAICVLGRDPGAQREEAWMLSACYVLTVSDSHGFHRVPCAGCSEQRAHRLSNMAFERPGGSVSLQLASCREPPGGLSSRAPPLFYTR